MTRAHLEEYLSRFADSKYLRAPADGAPNRYEDGKRCARLRAGTGSRRSS